MSARLFQYGTSSDPAVLAALEVRFEERVAFNARALAWAKERGFASAFLNNWCGHLTVTALPGKPEGFGQWKRLGHREQWAPFKNNHAEIDAMAAVAVDLTPIPGLPALVHSAESRNFGLYLMQPAPFVHAGHAWFGLGHIPDPTATRHPADQMGEQWDECKTSEFYAAREALEASERSAS